MKNDIGTLLKTAILAPARAKSRDRRMTEPSLAVHSVHANAIALFLNVLASAGLGYLSWLLAARVMDPEAVGVASAAVSAALLCSNLAILGLSTSIITFLPRNQRDPTLLLNGFLTIVILASSVCAGAFVVIAATLLDELRVLGANFLLSTSFFGLAIVTTVLFLLDGTSVALRRADFALIRGLIAGIAKLLILVFVWLTVFISAGAVVLAWFVSTLAACVLGYKQLRKSFPEYRYRPRISAKVARAAITNGLSNHALNLSRLAPSLIIPLVVAESLSPSENAYWYAAWMIAFLVRFIPIATAQAVFAEITNKAASLGHGITNSIWSNVVVSLAPTIVLIVFADPILSLMGESYSAAATTSLQVLALGIFPQIAMELYVVARRVTMRLAEPNIIFAVSGAASIAAAAYGAHVHGLLGVAIGWLVVETATGFFASVRLAQAIRTDTAEVGSL